MLQIWDTGMIETRLDCSSEHEYTLKNFFIFFPSPTTSAGQERFKALRTPFYRGTDICLLAYAINDRDSFKGLGQWRDEFLKYADVKGEQFPFIVVGNKVRIFVNFALVEFIHFIYYYIICTV